jgi:hypothetical protein
VRFDVPGSFRHDDPELALTKLIETHLSGEQQRLAPRVPGSATVRRIDGYDTTQ